MKTDGRVRYTRKVLKESLLSLLSQKAIQKITVTELCHIAQINRATFYTHYEDAFDLLGQIEDELFAELSATILAGIEDPDQLMETVLSVVKRNIELCRVLFSENGDRMFLRRIIDFAKDKTIALWRRDYPNAGVYQLDLLYTFLTAGSVAMIEQWVRTDMQQPPLELGLLGKRIREVLLAG